MSNDSTMYEGDIIQPSDRNAAGNTWPTVDIPYVISEELAGRTADILSAMAMVSEHTCVSFHQRRSETHYLIFKKSLGCSSYVGFVGEEQPVFLGPLCIVGNIVHELLHALGFYHEHTRADREQYITIFPKNIMPGMEKNFIKKKGRTFSLPYDVTSIMHYGRKCFSANGQATIVPATNAKAMGQRERMTQTDIQKVRQLYNCDEMENKPEKKTSTVRPESKLRTNTTSPRNVSAHTPAALQRLDLTTGGRNSSNN
ncbi:low choriolytic enzyme [Mastacembelus armatus]|uniref:low choriolytic enzyme n=1 Tax=Mastacembelus armatus TaxID=205130 RepID=UPI000E461FF2|nr:low choriolytic enzyme-like [Mastacembelus armatus]